jgi:hypothetical protein
MTSYGTASSEDRLTITITGTIWYWRGPSPFHFVSVPAEESQEIRHMASAVTYGWGMIPVVARVGKTSWKTSLFPKDGTYIVPLKDKVRSAEKIGVGDTITLTIEI